MDKCLFLSPVSKLPKMKQITVEQRYTIFVLKQQGQSVSFIADTIGKNRSSVYRELHRNCDKRSGTYNYDLAQRKCAQRHFQKSKHIRFTNDIQQYVDNLINEDYSPEQIVGRAKIDGKPCVSHERIYQHVWLDKKQDGQLHTHLRRKGRKYRKRGAAKDARGIIKNRIDIEQRPEIVNQKTRLGDLEIDTIIGENHKGAILTINDRVSGFLWIEKLNGKDANELAAKTIQKLKNCNFNLHTITADNGKEFAGHQHIAKELNIDFFFAKPYHSWERGDNEDNNGLIRQYFKKGTSFENVTNQEVIYVQNKLNNRPRKKLGFISPIEFLSRNLNINPVAFIT